jgi:hypothetical protein
MAGTFLRPQELGVAASAGLTHLNVKRRVKVAAFFTGDELSLPGEPLKPGGIYNSNRDTLLACLKSLGCDATDFGIVTRLVIEKLRGCRAINLESNHDVDMLMNGPYPWDLKQRIKSRHGHLSNEDSLQLLHELAHDRLEALVMAHLSEVNNHPDHVLRSTESFLRDQNVCSPRIVIGDQFRVGCVMEI